MQLWAQEPRHPANWRALEVEPPTVVKAVARLQEAGLVRRDRSSDDRRVVPVGP